MALQPVTTTRDVTVKFEGDLFKNAELNIVNIMYVTSIAVEVVLFLLLLIFMKSKC